MEGFKYKTTCFKIPQWGLGAKRAAALLLAITDARRGDTGVPGTAPCHGIAPVHTVEAPC